MCTLTSMRTDCDCDEHRGKRRGDCRMGKEEDDGVTAVVEAEGEAEVVAAPGDFRGRVLMSAMRSAASRLAAAASWAGIEPWDSATRNIILVSSAKFWACILGGVVG